MLRFDVRLALTKEEIVDGLHRAELRKAGKTRLVLQTVVLCTVAVWALAAFFGGGMQEAMSFIIGIAALILIPVMWFVPEWQMNAIAQSMTESGTTVRLWVFDDGIDFGEEQPAYAYYPFNSFYCSRPKEGDRQTLVMRFPNDDVIVVPKSLLTDEQWHFLWKKTEESKKA